MSSCTGEENFFLFGLTADQVVGGRSSYNPHWHYLPTASKQRWNLCVVLTRINFS